MGFVDGYSLAHLCRIVVGKVSGNRSFDFHVVLNYLDEDVGDVACRFSDCGKTSGGLGLPGLLVEDHCERRGDYEGFRFVANVDGSLDVVSNEDAGGSSDLFFV